jgi:hypothetical protein
MQFTNCDQNLTFASKYALGFFIILHKLFLEIFYSLFVPHLQQSIDSAQISADYTAFITKYRGNGATDDSPVLIGVLLVQDFLRYAELLMCTIKIVHGYVCIFRQNVSYVGKVKLNEIPDSSYSFDSDNDGF